MSYGDHFDKHLRITVLRILTTSNSCKANDSILCGFADELGVPTTRAKIRTELAWLAEQGLVTVQELPGLTVATLTERGEDVAQGRAVVPGVQRPTPKG